MAKIADGTFKNWVDTDTIDATEYKREREILRTAINDTDTRLEGVETYASDIGLTNVQMQKITDDTGGTKISITPSSKSSDMDILAELLEQKKGVHTFYAMSDAKNLPSTGLAIRGIAHFTDDTSGWVFAMDYKNNFFTNYCLSGVWTGWKEYVAVGDTQEALWTGAAYMVEGTVITPAKKLTDCRQGWVLVWSDYNPGVGPGNYDFHYSYIPKFIATKHNDSSHIFSIPRAPNAIITKALDIANDKITGGAGNDTGDNTDVALRYVLEW